MSKLRKSGLLSPESKIAATILTGLIVEVLWVIWLGHQSAVYRACLALHSNVKARSFTCSFSLLGGSASDYLIFALQWLPLGIVVGWIWHTVRRGEVKVIPPSSSIDPE